jgi:hypothetical protein
MADLDKGFSEAGHSSDVLLRMLREDGEFDPEGEPLWAASEFLLRKPHGSGEFNQKGEPLVRSAGQAHPQGRCAVLKSNIGRGSLVFRETMVVIRNYVKIFAEKDFGNFSVSHLLSVPTGHLDFTVLVDKKFYKEREGNFCPPIDIQFQGLEGTTLDSHVMGSFVGSDNLIVESWDTAEEGRSNDYAEMEEKIEDRKERLAQALFSCFQEQVEGLKNEQDRTNGKKESAIGELAGIKIPKNCIVSSLGWKLPRMGTRVVSVWPSPEA